MHFDFIPLVIDLGDSVELRGMDPSFPMLSFLFLGKISFTLLVWCLGDQLPGINTLEVVVTLLCF